MGAVGGFPDKIAVQVRRSFRSKKKWTGFDRERHAVPDSRVSNATPPKERAGGFGDDLGVTRWRRAARRAGDARLLSDRVGDADWLDGALSAGDLMMVAVLLRLGPSGILNESSNLAAYVARGATRPAYQRAFAAQLAFNTGKPAGG
jgi:glutathione S-transferase